MIILIIVIFTVLTFYGFMFIKNTFVRTLVGGVSVLVLALSVFALTAHLSKNWGMKEVTETSTQQVYTAGDKSAPYGMMIKSEIGQNTGNYVLVFRTSADQKEAKANFVPDQKHIVEAIKKTATYELVSADQAQVVTTTVRREFSSNLMSTLFGLGGERNELVSQKAVVKVPRDTWLVLTQAQVEKLSKEAPAMQKQMEVELKANPEKAMKLAELQKTNPKEYGKMQVEQIKQLLEIKD